MRDSFGGGKKAIVAIGRRTANADAMLQRWQMRKLGLRLSRPWYSQMADEDAEGNGDEDDEDEEQQQQQHAKGALPPVVTHAAQPTVRTSLVSVLCFRSGNLFGAAAGVGQGSTAPNCHPCCTTCCAGISACVYHFHFGYAFVYPGWLGRNSRQAEACEMNLETPRSCMDLSSSWCCCRCCCWWCQPECWQ
eukprot:919984-Pelagomonas_calceolata.AAC.6